MRDSQPIKTNNKLLTVNYLDNVNETANITIFLMLLAENNTFNIEIRGYLERKR
jgi:hypothetical protein